jgi:hypothetical protein
MRCIEPS